MLFAEEVSCIFVAEESGVEDWQVDWFTVCSDVNAAE